MLRLEEGSSDTMPTQKIVEHEVSPSGDSSNSGGFQAPCFNLRGVKRAEEERARFWGGLCIENCLLEKRPPLLHMKQDFVAIDKEGAHDFAQSLVSRYHAKDLVLPSARIEHL